MPTNQELLDKINQLVDDVVKNPKDSTTGSLKALQDACTHLPIDTFNKNELGDVARSMSRACKALYEADNDSEEAFALVHLGLTYIRKIKFNDFTSDNVQTYLSFLNHLIFLNNNDKNNILGRSYFNEMFDFLMSNRCVSKIFMEEHCDALYDVIDDIYTNVYNAYSDDTIPINFIQPSLNYIEKALELLETSRPNKELLLKKEKIACVMCKLLQDMHAMEENKIHYGLKQSSHALNHLELKSTMPVTMAHLHNLDASFINYLSVSNEEYYNNLIELSRGLFGVDGAFDSWVFVELYSYAMKINACDKHSLQKIEAMIVFMEIVDLGIRHNVVDNHGSYVLKGAEKIAYFQACLSNLKAHLAPQKDKEKSLEGIVSNGQSLSMGVANLVFSLKKEVNVLQKENTKLSRKIDELQKNSMYSRGGYRPTLTHHIGSSSTNSDGEPASIKKRRV